MLWKIIMFWKYRTWHYHYKCGKKFRRAEPILTGDPCPKCHHPFDHIKKMTCHGCRNVYYSDDTHNVGDRFNCPIKGERVILDDKRMTNSKSASRKVRLNYALILYALIFFLVFGFTLVILDAAVPHFLHVVLPGLLAFAASLLATLTEMLAAIWGVILVGIRILGVFVLGLITLFVAFKVVDAFMSRSSEPFNDIYSASQKDYPVPAIRKLLSIPKNTKPTHEILKKSLANANDVIQTQKVIISLQFIALVLLGLAYYLSIRAFEELWQAFQLLAGLSVGGILVFAVLYFALKRLFPLFRLEKQLKKQLPPLYDLIKGTGLAMMVGAASVITLVFLPPFLGQPYDRSSAIVATLSINLIADALITSYGAISQQILEPIGRLSRRSWEYWQGED